jgi:glutamine amidotransferase
VTVALINAGGANLASVQYALARLDADVRVVRDAVAVACARHVVLPGVGAAGPAMRALRARGFDRALPVLEVPLLGICLGMQLCFESSGEGDVACLGLLPGRVRALAPAPGVRVPHMGWNTLSPLREDAVLAGLPAETRAYFVHGFAVDVGPDCVATCTHGTPFAAVVRRGRVCGTQFHPERSGAAGARVLRNFLALS